MTETTATYANGQVPEIDTVGTFMEEAEKLSLTIDRDLREKGTVDLLEIKGEVVMLRLGFRTLIELLAAKGLIQLPEWDKRYTKAIIRERKRIANAGTKIALATALAFPPRGRG